MEPWFEGTVQANDLAIHYHRTGDAARPPLILLHGVVDNGLCWTRVARDLQGQFDVLMPDARGHGQTGGSLENISYDLLAEDVIAFIHALNLEKPILYGHSMGGLTAALVAAFAPDLVRAIIMEDPPFVDAPATEGERAKQAQDLSQAAQSIAALRSLTSEQRLAAARAFNLTWDEAELGPWVESKVEFDLDIGQYMQTDYPWREPLPRISCPILLITGDPAHQSLVTPQAAEEAARLWRNGEVVHIEGAGHSIHRDRYAETMQAVSDFLSRV